MAFSLHNTVIIPFHMADFNAIRMDFGGSMQKQTLPHRRNVCLSNKLRLPNSLSHGCAVPDLRRSACLPPAQRAASSTPSKRELIDQVVFRLSNKLRRTRRGAHCASAFCAESTSGSIIEANKLISFTSFGYKKSHLGPHVQSTSAWWARSILLYAP